MYSTLCPVIFYEQCYHDVKSKSNFCIQEHSSRSKGGTTKLSREKDDRESGAKSKRDRVSSSGKGARRSSLSAASPPPPQTHEDGRLRFVKNYTSNYLLDRFRGFQTIWGR